MKTYHAETVKPGYYTQKFEDLIDRCYYLSGSKKGNKWIEMTWPTPEWTTLMWTCIPKADELSECEFHETNPTKYLDIK